MKVNVFLMKCLTNLHVGNGDVNYNIIDQEVERDPVTGLPIINASGVKGAIREFFEEKWGKKDGRIKTIFGGNDSDKSQGTYKFLQADLLFRPLRVSDNSRRSFALATTEEVIKCFDNKIKGLGSNLSISDKIKDSEKTVELEGETQKLKDICDDNLKIFTGENIAYVNEETKKFNDYDLPVIARNDLDDNGISKNLWYEEFVPHESVFALIIMTPGEMDSEFKKALTAEPIQFGGNASIGYGLMKIREV